LFRRYAGLEKVREGAAKAGRCFAGAPWPGMAAGPKWPRPRLKRLDRFFWTSLRDIYT
jgi:hypothetical protein